MKTKQTWKEIDKNLIGGCFIIGFALFVLIVALMGDRDVMLFPRIIAIISLLSGIFALITFLRRKKDQEASYTDYRLMELAACIFMALLISLAKFIGFYTTLFIICIGIYGAIMIMTEGKNRKTIFKIIFFSLGVTVGVFVIFHFFLKIITPVGLLI